MILDNSVEVLFVTETWTSEHDTAAIAAFLPESHEFYHFPRGEGRGGGVGVAVSKSFKSVKTVNHSFKYFECMEISLRKNNKTISFYLIYKPPHSNKTQFFLELEPFFTESQTSCNPVVYLGDFNIWMNKPTDPNTIEMNEILDSFNLKNLVFDPTHISGNLLDLVLVNNDSIQRPRQRTPPIFPTLGGAACVCYI